MKCLFVMCKDATDHLASCLWDGLQEVLGEANVVDAVGHRLLHRSTAGVSDVLSLISGTREGRTWDSREGGFDLLVLNAAFLREYDWGWACRFFSFLRPGGKVAYVEGWDSAHEVHPPAFHVDAVFRKEINPAHQYPYAPNYLPFAAPSGWFQEIFLHCDRPCDVFFSGNLDTHSCRREAMAGVFRARSAKRVVVASKLDDSASGYFERLRQSKLVLCPAAADGAESLRTYEAIPCGAIPLFVGHPPWQRDDWFDGKAFQCATAGEVESHVNAALARDLPAMRQELWTFAREKHTTRARAEKLLREVGLL